MAGNGQNYPNDREATPRPMNAQPLPPTRSNSPTTQISRARRSAAPSLQVEREQTFRPSYGRQMTQENLGILPSQLLGDELDYLAFSGSADQLAQAKKSNEKKSIYYDTPHHQNPRGKSNRRAQSELTVDYDLLERTFRRHQREQQRATSPTDGDVTPRRERGRSKIDKRKPIEDNDTDEDMADDPRIQRYVEDVHEPAMRGPLVSLPDATRMDYLRQDMSDPHVLSRNRGKKKKKDEGHRKH